MFPGKSVVFCNALPSTEISFEEEMSHPQKDFIKHYKLDRIEKGKPYTWEAYYKQLIHPYRALKKFHKLGFKFVDECAMDIFIKEANNSLNNVIILFSHCINNSMENEKIEFYDRLVLSSDVVARLTNRPAIIDFSTCWCQYLKNVADCEKGELVIGSTTDFIPLSVWLDIYGALFETMVSEKATFSQAFNTTIINAKNKIDNLINGKNE
jgi:hypothetical protein